MVAEQNQDQDHAHLIAIILLVVIVAIVVLRAKVAADIPIVSLQLHERILNDKKIIIILNDGLYFDMIFLVIYFK